MFSCHRDQNTPKSESQLALCWGLDLLLTAHNRIKDEFRSLRWTGTNPKHLDVVNTQFLLVGESSGLDKATEPQKQDEKEGKEEPLEEMEKLEDEDTRRMEHLKGDESAAIFADLEVNAKDYPKIQTTF
jgi:hypothetical protein